MPLIWKSCAGSATRIDTFFDNREISPESQQQWYDRIQVDQRVSFHVIVVEGQTVWTILVTDRGDAMELGNLLLASEFRGRGIMTYACQVLMKHRYRYIATVRPENQDSRSLLERLGVEYVVLDPETSAHSEDSSRSVTAPRRLSIGAGALRRADWTTPDANSSIVPNIVARIPPLPESLTLCTGDEIEMSHFLPHLSPSEAEVVLREIRTTLRPGGRLVLKQPDIMYAAKVLTGVIQPPEGNRNQFDLWPVYGDPSNQDPHMRRYWGYHPDSLRALLIQVGSSPHSILQMPAEFHIPGRDFRLEVVT